MTDVHYWTAKRAARAIRSGEVSSRELVDAMLERIERVDPAFNTVVMVDAERARTEADAADTAVRADESLGPLHGVPMTVKDAFQTKGMRSTSGFPPLAEFSHNNVGSRYDRTITINGEARSYLDLFFWVSQTGVSFLPATSAPVGCTPEGLPVGIQIGGPFLEDRTTLDSVRGSSEINGGFQPPNIAGAD